MAKLITVLMTWIKMSASDMANFALGVAGAMDGNLTFPTPPVVPADLTTAANRLGLAWSNRLNGPKAKTELENADEAVDDMLHELAYYVSDIANGDSSIIESAAFVSTKDSRTKAVTPGTPGSVKISGNAARLLLIVAAVLGASAYCWVIWLGTPGTATISGNHIIITGGTAIVIPDGHAHEDLENVIPAGTAITVMVLAQNSGGKSGFSPGITVTVGS